MDNKDIILLVLLGAFVMFTHFILFDTYVDLAHKSLELYQFNQYAIIGERDD